MAKYTVMKRGPIEFRIIDGKLKDRWLTIAYLIIWDNFNRIEASKINPKVINEIDKHVAAYVNEGIEPPKAITTAIQNFADDYIATGEITIRTGDYLSIQKFVRKME